MRVRPKAPARSPCIVIEYPEHPKMHTFWIVVGGETEGVERIQPSVVGMPPAGRFVHNCLHGIYVWDLRS